MRDLTNKETVVEFMRLFGRHAKKTTRVYFTGGVSAVLKGWRDSTIDIDLRFEPDADELYRAIPKLKEELHINLEVASPSDFIPQLPGWEDRSEFIRNEGNANFYHYDFYSQALSKIERGHDKDRIDVFEMIRCELVDPRKLQLLFSEIEPQLYRYPAISPQKFAESVREAVSQASL